MKNKLRHIDSGELPWWMTTDDDNNNDDTTADDITLNQTESENTQATASVDVSDSNGARNWLVPPEDRNQGDAKKSMYRITHIRSGERAWWMDSDGNEADNQKGQENVNNNNRKHEDSAEPENSANYTFKIKRIESGEKAWWMTNDDPDTENTENIDFWSEINEKNEQERISRMKSQQERNAYQKSVFDRSMNGSSEGPLGLRASPEGLEDFTSHRRGMSPYPSGGGKIGEPFGNSSAKNLFISRHQNIDDLLGGTSHTMNLMVMSELDKSEPLEEILPTQVRIHDGTAHTSYVQYIGGDER